MIDRNDRAQARETPYPYNIMEVVGKLEIRGSELGTVEFTPGAIRALVEEALTERERRVIEQRYRDGMLLDEVARAHGVTRERIRQIEAKALRKLMNPTRLRNYAAVPYKEYLKEHNAKLRAENRLDWFLQHGSYRVELESEDKPVTKGAALDATIEEMWLSVRSFNCLARAGIRTAADIVGLDKESMERIRNLGPRSMNEIIGKIHALGLKMKWEDEEE